jgi:uncharacterized membrane protein YbhN (UPF0104 family)
VYSVVLAAALPGLTLRRGLLLNLSGSAVSNLLPLGGAAGTALNWRMARRWGHSNASFVTFCMLTNVLDVLTKLVLGLVALAALLLLSYDVPGALWVVGVGCATGLVGVAASCALAARFRFSGRLSRLHTRLDPVRHAVARMAELFGQRWFPLVVCSIGYVSAQVLLLDVSLRTVGLAPHLPVVMMAAALERLATLLPLSPGGVGLAELGAIAWLVSTGLSPAGVVAGVVLSRFFLFALEIPVGGAALAGWGWRQRIAVRAAGRGRLA